MPAFLWGTCSCSILPVKLSMKGIALGTLHIAPHPQRRKLRPGEHTTCILLWYLVGSTADTGAPQVSAPKPPLLWLYPSTSKQEGLAAPAPGQMVWQEISAVGFWAPLTCQWLFCADKSHCYFSVDPKLYSAVETGRLWLPFTQSSELGQLLTLTDPPLLFVLYEGWGGSEASQALGRSQTQGTEAGGQGARTSC